MANSNKPRSREEAAWKPKSYKTFDQTPTSHGGRGPAPKPRDLGALLNEPDQDRTISGGRRKC